MTATLQEAPDRSVPPLNTIVRETAFVDSVPLHCGDDPLGTVSPPGRVSVKLTPVKSTPVFGLVRVKVRVEVAPTETGLGENALLMAAGEGIPHPVKLTLSTNISEPELVFPALKK